MYLKKAAVVLGLILTITACEGNNNSQNIFTKENIGTATGAIAGAWIGSNVGKGKGNIVAIAAGTLLGSQIGKSIGRSLDQADLKYYDRASQNSLEHSRDNVTSTWENPNSGNSGTITPVKTYQQASGTYCREYTQTINVGGRTEQAYGTACRQSDGSWQIVN